MVDLQERAKGLASAIKTIRPYAGDIALGAAAAFLVRMVPLWLGATTTQHEYVIAAGVAVGLASLSLDWMPNE